MLQRSPSRRCPSPAAAYRACLWVWMLLGLPTLLPAQAPADWMAHLRILPPTGTPLTPDQAISALDAGRGVPYAELADIGAVYWGKVEVPEWPNGHWVLQLGQAHEINVWVKRDGNEDISLLQAGSWVPIAQRSLPNIRKPSLQLYVKHPMTLYLQWRHPQPQELSSPRLQLRPYREWAAGNENLRLWQGLFQGMILVLFLYHLAQYATGKDALYLYYAGYLITLSAYHLFYYGLASQYLYPDAPWLDDYVWLLSTHLSSIFYLTFVQHCCQIPAKMPRLHRWMQAYLWVKLAMMAGMLLLYTATHNYVLADFWQRLLFLGEECFFIASMAVVWRHGNGVARYVAVGTWILALSIVVYTTAAGWLAWDSYYYPVIMQWGAIGEIFLFAMALGYRARLREKARQRLQQQLMQQAVESEQRQAEARQELERQVAMRTRDLLHQHETVLLQHRNIESQNRQLRLLNEELENLMRIVAHDLKSPLNRIQGIMALLKMELPAAPPAIDEYIKLVGQSISTLKILISRILSTENSGAVPIHIERRSMNRLLEGLGRLFDPIAQRKKIRLDIVLPAGEVELDTDDTLMSAILENLLSNAIKFSHPGSRVSVALERREKEVEIRVSDEGPGFTEQDREKLFQRYQRLSAQPTGDEESTGLGLSIVKQYTEALGGRISLETEVGRGSMFSLDFPR